MTAPFSEAELVERPAMELLASMGWAAVDATNEIFGAGGTLGRSTAAEVVLRPRLRAALARLNPNLAPEGLTQAEEALTRDRSAMGLLAANRELYDLAKQGVLVEVPDGKGGRTETRARVIAWDQPQTNDFVAVQQLTVTGQLYTCRPDIVGFVNGMPWVLIECKATGVPAKRAFDDNLTSYKHPLNGIPRLCAHNAVLIATNGTDSRVGSLSADWDRFGEWKRIASEDEPRRVSLEVLLRGVCDPGRLLDLVENFTVYSDTPDGTIKILGQNHQVIGVNAAITALRTKPATDPRLGVFWHTQGSGKSFAMLFFAQKVLRTIPGNWTFVVVTDRAELDEQIVKTFTRAGAISEAESRVCPATSGERLCELLRSNHRYVFTLIHKFRDREVVTTRQDVIVLADEAHRSQYSDLALNMRAAMPGARYLAFTGTPLIAGPGGDEVTRQVFGDYVSIYDFQQSVEDNATLPLFYENRTPELEITNPDLDDELLAVVEAADLDEEGDRALARALGRRYQVLTRTSRLRVIAADIVSHFLGRGFVGKAMVVSLDKATAVRMYDLVREAWQAELARVDAALVTDDAAERTTLLCRRELLTSTDMAVIVSAGQNEVEQMQAMGLDIVPHRNRMVSEHLDERFKKPQDPLRLVFVCAMWLTGFDAPSCSTVYLDKPMRNHTLMQTIARANRVWGSDKKCGLIVDYANVFASLEEALAVYGKGSAGDRPVADKAALIADLAKAVDEATALCRVHQVEPAALSSHQGLSRLSHLDVAVEALIAPDDVRKVFLASASTATTLYLATLPDHRAEPYADAVAGLAAIADAIRAKLFNPVDISAVLTAMSTILDGSVEATRVAESSIPPIDLSRIDFARLRQSFPTSPTKNTDLETLKAAVRARLERMVRINRSRAEYLARFEALVSDYNAGSRTIDELFAELLALCRSLDEESQRHVREHVSEDELAIFDLLTKPDPVLTSEEREAVKKVVRALLEQLRRLLAPGWRERVTARAEVKHAIESTLDEKLPRAYTPEIFGRKSGAVFAHLLEQQAG
jgi:type I restriction enzyme, R subunit